MMTFRRMRARVQGEEGFTVLEVLVAFTLLAIVTLGTVPLFITGLRTSLVSKLDTGAKNLAQQQLEAMRNEQFYALSSNQNPSSSCISSPSRTNPLDASGNPQCDYKDFLDTYYRSAITAATCPTTDYFSTTPPTGGFVSAASTCRTSDEPAGPFYRYVINPVPGFQNRYSQFIATQFIDVTATAVTPATTYNTQDSDLDFPPSRIVSVTIVTVWKAGGLTKKLITYSRIAEGPPEVPNVTVLGKATALHIASTLPSGDQLIADAGISSSDGLLTNDASAGTSEQGAFASLTPAGTRIDGKLVTVSAPPNTTVSSSGVGALSLLSGSTEVACFANTDIENVSVSIQDQQPLVATSTAQAKGRLKNNSAGCTGESLGLGFNNFPTSTALPGLDVTKKMVRVISTGSADTAFGSSYLASASGAGHFAKGGSSASAQTIKIIPTSFAPDGVVQITLNSASLDCLTNGTTSSATGAFSATVSYFNNSILGYTSTTITRGGTNTLPDLNSTFVQVGVPLSTYISSWSALSTESTTSSGSSITSRMNGIVSLTTKPTRLTSGLVPDASAAISLQVGILSCSAEDTR